MKETEADPYYAREAKRLTDLLFNKGFLADDLARESIDALQEFLGSLLQAQCESAVRAALLMKQVRERNARPQTQEGAQP